MNRRTMSAVAGLTLGALVAMLGPRYIAAGTYSYVGNYSYKKVGTFMWVQSPWEGVRGGDVQVRATLRDRHRYDPIPGAYVRFRIGDEVEWARTNKQGRASVTISLDDVAPGRHRVRADFGGDDEFLPSGDQRPMRVRWEGVYVDDAGTGRINLNPSTKEFQFQAPGDETEILEAPRMRVISAGGVRTLSLAYDDGVVTVAGEFELDTELFSAIVNTDLGSYALVGAPLVGGRSLREGTRGPLGPGVAPPLAA